MTLPNFLILGAMKAGTTSLADALAGHPDVFIPATKEPSSLSSSEVLTPAGTAEYRRLFDRAGEATARGEASTNYTKRHLGGADAASNARELLGPDVRLIYLLRDPVARAASHARHLLLSGRDFDPVSAVKATDPVCELGCYAYQLAPWIDAFGTDRLLVLDMADLIGDWPKANRLVSRHLNIDPEHLTDSLGRSNSSDDARPASGAVGRFLQSPTYRRALQERIPMPARRALRRLLIRRAPAPDISAANIAVSPEALERWASDRKDLAESLGVEFIAPELDRRLA